MEPSYYQKEHSSKWNTHIIKRNTHQKGTLILSKWNSLNRNTHIIALAVETEPSHLTLHVSLISGIPIIFGGQDPTQL